jgi:hypothetical protein
MTYGSKKYIEEALAKIKVSVILEESQDQSKPEPKSKHIKLSQKKIDSYF